MTHSDRFKRFPQWLNDPEAAVRAAAVASLGPIDHESVFAPMPIALSDESREFRAAAAEVAP